VTGDGLDEELRQFVKRESKEDFEQRVNITKHIIPSVVSNLTAPERKVPRSNGMVRTVTYGEAEKDKTKDLEKILAKFWGNKSFDDWMATRWLELNDIDPNAFVVFEWKDFDSDAEKLQPYPYEVNSHQAIMFEYINNILKYLVDCREGRYTMYLENETILLTKIEPKDVTRTVEIIEKDQDITDLQIQVIEETGLVSINDVIYSITIPSPSHESGRVPAMRVGYKRDAETNGDTYVSPYNDAMPYLDKTLKANSELDLTMALHAFPQKIVTTRPCINTECNGGQVFNKEGEITTCKTCDGGGLMIHKSAQDIIMVKAAQNADEQFQLDNMVMYVTPDIDLLKFQDEYIDELTIECQRAMYNSDIFTKEEVSTTATEKVIELDNIYDTLYPLSVDYAKDWKYGVDTIAILVDMFKGLVAVMSFSKDFKFKSKDDLLDDRKKALDAGSPDSILRDLDDDYMRISTTDNPIEYARYKTMQYFDPFSGKNDVETIAAKTSGTVPKSVIVLDDNYGWIFDNLETKNPEFFLMTRDKQRELIEKAVEEIIKELDSQQPSDPILNV